MTSSSTASDTRARRNWAGNYAYRARMLHAPDSIEALQEIMAAAPRIRVLGSRHAFTGIADTEELVTLERLPSEVSVDRAAMTVTAPGALRYGALVEELGRHGLALANLASLPHIAIAGAIATATHGSGDRNGNLATAVTALDLVTSDGRLITMRRGDPDFEGIVVGLGALGAVLRVTLAVEPEYAIAQHVYTGLAWDALAEHFDAITAAGYSVSVFHRFGERTDAVWVKRRTDSPPPPAVLHGARPAPGDMHPIAGLDAVNATPQRGEPGRWSERLPHFRMGFTPSSGAEIQSEYLLPRAHAVEALGALRRHAATLRPLTQVSELRTVAADGLWMSPEYGRDTFAVHFTWQPDQPAVERALRDVESALAPFAPRPHWGKLFLSTDAPVGERYPRHRDFVELAERLDPRGALRNDWFEQHVLGGR